MSVFETLSAVNVNEHIERKNGLSYLSWAWAWQEAKKAFPEAQYKIYENADGWNYFTDGRTAWVKTGVIIQGQEHIEYLPIMDYRNKSLPLDKITSFDVNKTIQRSLTKALARHGLGLYIYAGEDLPESDHKNSEQLADDVYPSNEVMLDLAKQKIGEKKLLEGYKIDSLEQLTRPQLMALYNRVKPA